MYRVFGKVRWEPVKSEVMRGDQQKTEDGRMASVVWVSLMGPYARLWAWEGPVGGSHLGTWCALAGKGTVVRLAGQAPWRRMW